MLKKMSFVKTGTIEMIIWIEENIAATYLSRLETCNRIFVLLIVIILTSSRLRSYFHSFSFFLYICKNFLRFNLLQNSYRVTKYSLAFQLLEIFCNRTAFLLGVFNPPPIRLSRNLRKHTTL